jgi:molybdopterin molybdotransferase
LGSKGDGVTQHPAPTVTQPTWAEARELSFAAATVGREEDVPLAEAVDRRLAHDLVADYDLPHYASSAMDGWAVCGPPPWTVVVETDTLRTGECRIIVTGAPVPGGANAVLRSEHAVTTRESSVDYISPSAAARADEPREGEHIRPIGTEAHAGDLLIRAGTRLNPAHVGLAASLGYNDLTVFARPRVRVVVTGDEVVGAGVPSLGRVRDSFAPTLPWLVAGLGGVVVSVLHVGDSKPALIDALSAEPYDHELVVSTGGTGRSGADHLHPAITELGATILADGIRMRPGHPSVFAQFPDGRILVGLPGNPLAAILGLITLAEPLLAAMTGAPMPRTEGVPVGADIPGRRDVSLLVPYRIEEGGAVPSAWSGSGMMRGLAASAGVLVCPPSGLTRGAVAEAFALPWAVGRQ